MFKAIIPATDWYFVHEGHESPVVWPLAAWALNEGGEAIGLVGAFGREQGLQGKTPSLSAVPHVPGRYLHRTQLAKQEIDLAAKRAQLNSAPVA